MIQRYSFGHMVIAGKTYTFDLKIIQGEVIPLWRRKTGHVVDIDDVKDVLEVKPGYFVLGTGIGGNVRVKEELLRELELCNIELIAELTPEAVETFNRMNKSDKNIAAGFHLTC